MKMVSELVLTVPPSVGAKSTGQGPRSGRSKSGLEAARGGSPEDGQGPIKSIHSDQIFLPPFDIVSPVTIQGQGAGVFVVASAAMGSELVGLLVEIPVLVTYAPVVSLFPVEMRFDPSDVDQRPQLNPDSVPQVAVLLNVSNDSQEELAQPVGDIATVGQEGTGPGGRL